MSSFFVKWNDIDVFVEDTALHAKRLYVSLVGRALPDTCNVTEVFPLGNRQSVIDQCLADVGKGGRNRIYLIDGDLDLIMGAPPPVVDSLFSHRLYHVENYFLCEAALMHILEEENPRFSVEEIAQKLEFALWVSEMEPLRDLFSTFGVSKLLSPELPTIKVGVDRFTAVNRELDPQRVFEFCAERMALMYASHPKRAVDAAIKTVNAEIERSPTFLDVIAAREYLFPLLKRWIASKGLRLPSGNESLFYRLSKWCALDRHVDFVEAVRTAAKPIKPKRSATSLKPV